VRRTGRRTAQPIHMVESHDGRTPSSRGDAYEGSSEAGGEGLHFLSWTNVVSLDDGVLSLDDVRVCSIFQKDLRGCWEPSQLRFEEGVLQQQGSGGGRNGRRGKARGICGGADHPDQGRFDCLGTTIGACCSWSSSGSSSDAYSGIFFNTRDPINARWRI
jgi:hypothetical protein